MNELLEKMQAEIVELTRLMREKSEKGLEAEVKELSAKLETLIKDRAERKHQFEAEVALNKDLNKKDIETKMDELFIASALCVHKDGTFDHKAYSQIVGRDEYQEVIKASGFTVDAGSTGAAGYGAEFIPTAFSSTLQEEIWLQLEIANLFGRINMPAQTFVLPFAPKRMIGKLVAEAGAPTKNKAQTGKFTFSAVKVMANVEFTDELDAESIIAILPFVRKQLIDGFAITQETMCLNGDKGTTIYASAPGASAEDCRRGVNGIREDAKNAAKANNMTAYATDLITSIRTARANMGKYGKKPSDLAYICDMADYNTLIGTAAFQTLYSYGQGATLLTGELGRVDNIPIIVTELLPTKGVVYGDATADLPDALGAVTTAGVYGATDAGNIKKVSVLVNKEGYMWGDRAAFSLETFRNPFNQTLNLIGSQRLDFQKVLAAADKTTSTIYNY